MQLAFHFRPLRFVAFLFIFALAPLHMAWASKVTMTGASYSISGLNVTLTVPTIQNADPVGTKSGALDVELWATIFPHDDQPAVGYLLAHATLDPLPGQAKYENVSKFLRLYEPPSGTYQISIVLAEWNGAQFAVAAWQDLGKTDKFGWKTIAPPLITSSTNATAIVDAPFSFQVVAKNNPAEFRATGLPNGLALNRSTGVIAGRPTQPGVFNVTLSAGNNGGVNTKPLQLTVGMVPKFTLRPASTNVFAGGRATFAAAGLGFPLPKLQWQRNGLNINGATNASFVIPSAQTKHEGFYRVLASNTYGTVSSGVAFLSVCDYVLSPANAAFGVAGGTGSVEVAVSGGCSWDVINTNSWIHLTSGTNGDGSGVFTYSVDANTNGIGRVGHLFIANKQFALTQSTYAAPPSAAGMTFSFKSTNGNNVFFPEQFQIITAQRTNDINAETTNEACRLMLGGTNSVECTYNFLRVPFEPGAISVLSLSNSLGTNTIVLTFANRRTGTFVVSSGEQIQNGTFAMMSTPADFNGDGLPDLVLQNGRGDLAAWLLDGTNLLESAPIRRGVLAAKVGAVADFNHDGNTDLLLRTDSGNLDLWRLEGTNFIGRGYVSNVTLQAGASVVGAADFDRDTQTDVVLFGSQGVTSLGFFAGTNFGQEISARNGTKASPGWRIAGAGDFSDQGYADILWQHNDGRLAVWHFFAGQFVNSTSLKSVNPRWTLAAVTDLNRDSRLDLVWQHDTGKLAVWFMDGTNFLSSALIGEGVIPDLGRKVVGPK